MEKLDNDGLLAVLPVSAESAGLLPNRKGNGFPQFQLLLLNF